MEYFGHSLQSEAKDILVKDVSAKRPLTLSRKVFYPVFAISLLIGNINPDEGARPIPSRLVIGNVDIEGAL